MCMCMYAAHILQLQHLLFLSAAAMGPLLDPKAKAKHLFNILGIHGGSAQQPEALDLYAVSCISHLYTSPSPRDISGSRIPSTACNNNPQGHIQQNQPTV